MIQNLVGTVAVGVRFGREVHSKRRFESSGITIVESVAAMRSSASLASTLGWFALALGFAFQDPGFQVSVRFGCGCEGGKRPAAALELLRGRLGRRQLAAGAGVRGDRGPTRAATAPLASCDRTSTST
eukprot:2110359-Rhodomonas_salina.3